MAQADDLGNLILNLNPYTNNQSLHHPTGPMDIYVGNPNPGTPPNGTIANIQIEVDTNYPGEWSFKGEPQKVNTAFRFPYRYPVRGPAGAGGAPGPILYWVTDYVLIGFEGSGGGA